MVKNNKAALAKKAPKMSAEEKEAKKAARKEALKNRPAGQRTNSKQIDIIEMEHGKVTNFGYAIRKVGTLVTSVATDEKGNILAVSTSLVPGTKVKTKKEHGMLVPGVAGEGKKKGSGDENSEEDED